MLARKTTGCYNQSFEHQNSIMNTSLCWAGDSGSWHEQMEETEYSQQDITLYQIQKRPQIFKGKQWMVKPFLKIEYLPRFGSVTLSKMDDKKPQIIIG